MFNQGRIDLLSRCSGMRNIKKSNNQENFDILIKILSLQKRTYCGFGNVV